MNRLLKYIALSLLITTIGGACESLEDTYSDYAGDGRIRYVSKCADLVAAPGWETVNLTWTNGLDAAITNVCIEWSAAGVIDRVVLDKNTDRYTVTNLKNYTYEFKVYAVDKAGNRSIEALAYERPYTLEHEMISTFTKVVLKYFKISNDKLVLFFDSWNDKIRSVSLNYTQAGVQKTLELTKEIIDAKYYMLSGVDLSKPIVLNRRAVVEQVGQESGFAIDYPAETLDMELRTIGNDFAAMLKRTLKVKELTSEVLGGVTELDIDYELSSLEDILYLPNLKVLNLGKNRYLLNAYKNDSQTVLHNQENSLYALKTANEILGLKINRYNKHFFTSTNSYITECGNPVLPTLEYLDASQWSYEHTPVEQGHDSHAEFLLDQNPSTNWSPLSNSTTLRTHEVVFDMKSSQKFRGFKITQITYTNKYAEMVSYLPNIINIQVSDDGRAWTNSTFEKDNTLGIGSGETTLIYTDGEKSARYVKIIVTDMMYYALRYNVMLADFAVIK